MARQQNLIVPVPEKGRSHRRSSTTDDRQYVTADNSDTTAQQRPSILGASQSCPILIDEGEVADRTSTPVKQALRTARLQDEPPKPRPRSAQKPRAEQPETPGRDRPQPHREAASDPGSSRVRPEVFPDSPISFGKRPCGLRAYRNPGGAWDQKHRMKCKPCRDQPSDQAVGGESDGDDESILSTLLAAETNDEESDDSLTQAINRRSGDIEPAKKIASGQTDNSASMVHHRLLMAARRDLTPEEKEGFLYILRCSEHPGLLKLGCSTNPEKRGKQHKGKCGLTITWVHISNCVTHMKRAEKLAKLDMGHLRREGLKCSSCSQTHTEWFHVDEQEARLVADRWVDWINGQSPYTGGKLKPMWGWLLNVQRAPRPPFEEHDHETRWAHWDSALPSPSRVEKLLFKGSELAALRPPQPEREVVSSPERQPANPDRRNGTVRPRSTVVEVALSRASDAMHTGNTYNFIETLNMKGTYNGSTR